MTAAGDAENNDLRQRIKSLEAIEREYYQLKNLLFEAARNEDLGKYANEIVLCIHPDNGQIVDASKPAIEFLGYTREDLEATTIDALEIASFLNALQTSTIPYFQPLKCVPGHCTLQQENVR